MPVIKKINKDFFKEWSSDMAYILGFFAADGYITLNRRGGQFWCLHIADKKLLLKIRNTIGSEHAIGVRKSKNSPNLTYRLQIGSVEMCDDLHRLGFGPKKTKSLAVPLVPERYFPDFLRGYFDGDGNVWTGFHNKHRKTPTKTMATCFTSCSSGFLVHLKKRLEKNNIIGGCLICQKGYSRLQYSTNNSKQLYNIMYAGNSRSRLYLERKKCVFEEYMRS